MKPNIIGKIALKQNNIQHKQDKSINFMVIMIYLKNITETRITFY